MTALNRAKARAVLTGLPLTHQTLDRVLVALEACVVQDPRITRIEALHRPDGGVGGPGAMCVECTPDFGTPYEEPVPWPCNTIRALSE